MLIAVCSALNMHAAVIYTELFSGNTSGWSSSGLTSYGYSAGEGNVPGSLVGSMNPSGMFPQFGAFIAEEGASSGSFAGDYLTEGAQSIRFDFMSGNVAPQTLSLVLSSGSSAFVYSFAPLLNLDTWATYTAPLISSAGWVGSGSFNAVLLNVDKVQIQFASDTPGAQSYYLDNVSLNDEDLPTVIPEPGSGMLVLLLGMILWVLGSRRSNNSLHTCLSGKEAI